MAAFGRLFPPEPGIPSIPDRRCCAPGSLCDADSGSFRTDIAPGGPATFAPPTVSLLPKLQRCSFSNFRTLGPLTDLALRLLEDDLAPFMSAHPLAVSGENLTYVVELISPTQVGILLRLLNNSMAEALSIFLGFFNLSGRVQPLLFPVTASYNNLSVEPPNQNLKPLFQSNLFCKDP